MSRKIIIIFTFLITNLFSFAQTINDDICWEYFEITRKLKNNQPLEKSTWEDFLKNEAIQVYLKDQGVDSAYIERYRQIMEIVYMPKNQTILDEQLKDQNKYWWTYIVNEYKLHEEDMKKYLKKLKKEHKKYFETGYQYTYQMLPKEYQKKVPDYKVSIIPIHNDAHIRNDWMIFTLMTAYFSDLNKYGVLAGHEFHHVLRPRLVFEVEDQDKVIISLLQRILNEGSADLIDKRHEGNDASLLLEFQRGYPESFIEEGSKIIKNIDEILSQPDLDPSKLSINKLIDSWNTSGHIPGYYMANIIEKNGLKKDLIKNIHDPFEFVYLYEKASENDPDAYRFSPATINSIKDLDSKYRPLSKIYLYEKIK